MWTGSLVQRGGAGWASEPEGASLATRPAAHLCKQAVPTRLAARRSAAFRPLQRTKSSERATPPNREDVEAG